jgi:hypothetical protein
MSQVEWEPSNRGDFGESRMVTGRGIPDKETRTNPLARTTNYGD